MRVESQAGGGEVARTDEGGTPRSRFRDRRTWRGAPARLEPSLLGGVGAEGQDAAFTWAGTAARSEAGARTTLFEWTSSTGTKKSRVFSPVGEKSRRRGPRRGDSRLLVGVEERARPPRRPALRPRQTSPKRSRALRPGSVRAILLIEGIPASCFAAQGPRARAGRRRGSVAPGRSGPPGRVLGGELVEEGLRALAGLRRRPAVAPPIRRRRRKRSSPRPGCDSRRGSGWPSRGRSGPTPSRPAERTWRGAGHRDGRPGSTSKRSGCASLWLRSTRTETSISASFSSSSIR